VYLTGGFPLQSPRTLDKKSGEIVGNRLTGHFYLSLTAQVQAENPVFQRLLFFLIKPVPIIIVPETEIFGLSFTNFLIEFSIWWISWKVTEQKRQ